MNYNKLPWFPLIGWDKSYEICPQGYIRRKGASAPLASDPNSAGYARVWLSERGKGRKRVAVHRTVALQFCPNDDREAKTTVHHIDEDKNNNSALNLEWLTPEEHNRLKRAKADTYKRNPPVTPKLIKMWQDGYAAGMSTMQLARLYGYHRTTIARKIGTTP